MHHHGPHKVDDTYMFMKSNSQVLLGNFVCSQNLSIKTDTKILFLRIVWIEETNCI